MNRPEIASQYANFLPFTEELTKQLVEMEGSGAIVNEFLLKEGYFFNNESIQNLVMILSIYRKIPFTPDCIFFIYGSTARGTAKAGERIQEFQFWEEERFLGSCFRRRGGSDIDLRIITQDREELLPTLEAVSEDLKLTSARIELRVDNPSYAVWEATRADTSSFFRRVLALNRPLVLHGKKELECITKLAYSHLTSEDYANETQRIGLKLLVLRETAEKPFVFWTENQLQERFPSYYSPLQLEANNSGGYPSPIKVSLVSGESSLVVIPVSRAVAIDRFITYLKITPDISVKQLIGGLREDGLA